MAYETKAHKSDIDDLDISPSGDKVSGFIISYIQRKKDDLKLFVMKKVCPLLRERESMPVCVCVCVCSLKLNFTHLTPVSSTTTSIAKTILNKNKLFIMYAIQQNPSPKIQYICPEHNNKCLSKQTIHYHSEKQQFVYNRQAQELLYQCFLGIFYDI